MSMPRALALGFLACAALLAASRELVQAQLEPELESRSILEIEFTPTRYAQIAVWIENEAGELLATVGLTEAVATRGIGNRPGASQMNSGFRWPYGRREGALPIWAHRRASAPGAKQFKRVIFQDRTTEGLASRTSEDYSTDDYFCLSFDSSRAQKDALDAVSCASLFSSDKGRFITEADVDAGYAEPYVEVASGEGIEQPLSLHSLYPARRDVIPCAPDCHEHADVANFDADARDVMPDIDAVTMATPPGDEPKTLLYAVPPEWQPGEYRACLEINVEGDHNAVWNPNRFATPVLPDGAWDSWAMTYGYPYRGQPSVVYCTAFTLGGETVQTFHTDAAEGSAGSWDTFDEGYGELAAMDGMTDDPAGAPGSGADRLRLSPDGDRMTVVVKPPLSCEKDAAPSAVTELRLGEHPDELHAHQWATLSFRAAGDDVGVFRYEVRVSAEPMPDEASFMRGVPAKTATLEAEELRIPTEAERGELIRTQLGGLVALTHYYVGVRSVDACAHRSPVVVAEITTPERTFATVTPCFVATAAYGTPMAREIVALRHFRDRYLNSNALGRSLVGVYEQLGPKLADAIRDREQWRAVARTVLSPFVTLAGWLSD